MVAPDEPHVTAVNPVSILPGLANKVVLHAETEVAEVPEDVLWLYEGVDVVDDGVVHHADGLLADAMVARPLALPVTVMPPTLP